MEWTTILALLVTIALAGYLAIALLTPEKFS
ncbi:MAG: potassium-transporting ATPase subunit F [Planctomycetes bacterium SCN 63-9]|nr:MAG: potassium-transporting ATPase subunit F [Planctomycetes bacterium SCN 63-9]